mmetsp:Transcript_9194/g.18243  ORF Transcript_9194/g.18243 Transcript_9194/m.18243 type:complete len:126 (+) Transcript_9194:91-468(+)
MGVSTRKSKATSPKNARLEKRGHGSVRQKKKTKIQAKKAAFREKLKVEHASKTSGKTQMKKKKRNKKKYTALNDMKSLAETLGDFGQHDSLAMKVTTVKTAKQRDRILYVFFTIFVHGVYINTTQ